MAGITVYNYDTQLPQSIEKQKAAAVADPETFEDEIRKTQIIAGPTLQDPKDKTSLCRTVVSGNVCKYRECRFAHRITTYVAVNLSKNRDFKLAFCGDRMKACVYGDHCNRVHPGDLAQRRIPGGQGKREWYIASKKTVAEEKAPIVIHVQTMNINITAPRPSVTPPPPYRSPEPYVHRGIFTPEQLGHSVRPVVRPDPRNYAIPEPRKLRPSLVQQQLEDLQNDPARVIKFLGDDF